MIFHSVVVKTIFSNSSARVKSFIFGQTAKFGQRPGLFHISNIGIKINYFKLVSHWDASNLRLFRDQFETRFGDRNTTFQP